MKIVSKKHSRKVLSWNDLPASDKKRLEYRFSRSLFNVIHIIADFKRFNSSSEWSHYDFRSKIVFRYENDKKDLIIAEYEFDSE
jgi:hypothetical protein